jgi:hypothetical protein
MNSLALQEEDYACCALPANHAGPCFWKCSECRGDGVCPVCRGDSGDFYDCDWCGGSEECGHCFEGWCGDNI